MMWEPLDVEVEDDDDVARSRVIVFMEVRKAVVAESLAWSAWKR